MCGIYTWDFSPARREMDSEVFERQLKHYFNLILDKKIDGMIVCSSTIGDADLETNRILKRYIAEYGDREIE